MRQRNGTALDATGRALAWAYIGGVLVLAGVGLACAAVAAVHVALALWGMLA